MADASFQGLIHEIQNIRFESMSNAELATWVDSIKAGDGNALAPIEDALKYLSKLLVNLEDVLRNGLNKVQANWHSVAQAAANDLLTPQKGFARNSAEDIGKTANHVQEAIQAFNTAKAELPDAAQLRADAAVVGDLPKLPPSLSQVDKDEIHGEDAYKKVKAANDRRAVAIAALNKYAKSAAGSLFATKELTPPQHINLHVSGVDTPPSKDTTTAGVGGGDPTKSGTAIPATTTHASGSGTDHSTKSQQPTAHPAPTSHQTTTHHTTTPATTHPAAVKPAPKPAPAQAPKPTPPPTPAPVIPPVATQPTPVPTQPKPTQPGTGTGTGANQPGQVQKPCGCNCPCSHDTQGASQNPAQQTPGQQSPSGQNPGQQTPGQNQSGQTPNQQNPTGQNPGQQTPTGQTPTGQNPVGQTPGQHDPSQQNPVQQDPNQQGSTGQAPVQHQHECPPGDTTQPVPTSGDVGVENLNPQTGHMVNPPGTDPHVSSDQTPVNNGTANSVPVHNSTGQQPAPTPSPAVNPSPNPGSLPGGPQPNGGSAQLVSGDPTPQPVTNAPQPAPLANGGQTGQVAPISNNVVTSSGVTTPSSAPVTNGQYGMVPPIMPMGGAPAGGQDIYRQSIFRNVQSGFGDQEAKSPRRKKPSEADDGEAGYSQPLRRNNGNHDDLFEDDRQVISDVIGGSGSIGHS